MKVYKYASMLVYTCLYKNPAHGDTLGPRVRLVYRGKILDFASSKYASMQLCKYAIMQICKYASI